MKKRTWKIASARNVAIKKTFVNPENISIL